MCNSIMSCRHVLLLMFPKYSLRPVLINQQGGVVSHYKFTYIDGVDLIRTEVVSS
jgi:hypothetical protein